MTTQENILARHKILHELGRGSSGTVYAAHERTTDRVVALKRIHPEAAKSVAGFVQQARAARRLDHPNIVKVLDAGEAAGTAYVAMEMVEGESLRKLLDAGPLPVARAIRILHDAAAGLAHAHLEGVVHGAIKPSNVFVLRSGAAKLADFGLGQPAAAYRAPEQAGGGPVDHRSDLYSLGALFHEMLAGQPPCEGAPPLSEMNPNVPRALDALVAKMLAAQPAARMPGVPVLLGELKRLEEALGLGSDAPAPPKPEVATPPPQPKPEPRKPEPRRFEEIASGGDSFRPITDRELMIRLAMLERERRPPPPPRSRTPVLGALALALLGLGIGVAGFTGVGGYFDDWSARIEQGIAPNRNPIAATPASVKEAPPPAPPASVAQMAKEAPAPVARAEPPVAAPAEAPPPAPLPPEPIRAEPEPLPPGVVLRQPAPPSPPAPPARAERAPAKQLPRPETAKVAKQAKGAAQLLLSVSPRGELYINGEHYGATPPITKLEIEPGMHRIEVRNGSRKPYLTYMTVEPGDVRRIRHDFNAKPLRPPG